MKITIKIEKPIWCKTTSDPRLKVVSVSFENQEFKWIPTYEQIYNIFLKLLECERTNKEMMEK